MSSLHATSLSDSEGEEQQPRASSTQASRRVRMVDVHMPSGLTVGITVPARSCNCTRCDFNVRLTFLDPDGVMGAREYQLVAREMTSTIRQHALQERAGGRFTSYDIVSIHKVQNCCLWKKFRSCERALHRRTGYVNQLMLFHGSPATNTIAAKGFDQSCAKTGGMFGPAIYFAKHSSKSNQYAYGNLGGNGCPTHRDKNCYVCERKILLCRVALGRMYNEKKSNKMSRPPRRYNSVSGQPSRGGLKFPEYAIYDVDQAYPEYLITYKIVQ